MKFDILTIFPNVFQPYIQESVLKRGQMKGAITITVHNLRDFTTDPHKTVDDRPYGGGAGMLLMIEPIYKALKKIVPRRTKKNRVVMLAPTGKRFVQADAVRLAKYDQLVLLCGRYEGFDARVEMLVDEKISIGDFVLSGGELPALIVMEAVARHVPGVLGNSETLAEESFSGQDDFLEYPHYTRPEVFKPKGMRRALRVPKVLLSGNHKLIAAWRASNAGKKSSK